MSFWNEPKKVSKPVNYPIYDSWFKILLALKSVPGSTWNRNKPIYESLYELSDDDDVIGSEGSANGQKELENGEGFVKISKETLLWILIGSSIVSLGKE